MHSSQTQTQIVKRLKQLNGCEEKKLHADERESTSGSIKNPQVTRTWSQYEKKQSTMNSFFRLVAALDKNGFVTFILNKLWCESTTNPVPVLRIAVLHRAVSPNWPKIESGRPMVSSGVTNDNKATDNGQTDRSGVVELGERTILRNDRLSNRSHRASTPSHCCNTKYIVFLHRRSDRRVVPELLSLTRRWFLAGTHNSRDSYRLPATSQQSSDGQLTKKFS